MPMSRREFGKNLAGGLGGLALASAGVKAGAASASQAGAGGAAARRPNIVFLLSDQHAFKYCGFMGHGVVRTPNLDRIAGQGVVFRSAYCGNPLCAPSRAGMISGVYPSDVNSFCNTTCWDGSLPAWPALMREAGYTTFGTGKMDTSDEFEMGFDEAPNLKSSHWKNPDITGFFRRPLCFRPAERDIVRGAPRDGRHADGALADATGAFIRRQAGGAKAGGAKPWVAYCGMHMPHPEFRGLREYYDEYLETADMPPEPSPGEWENMHPVCMQLRNFKNLSIPVPRERVRAARAGYYAMITELDEYAGRIWRALGETGQLENTIFVYTSDHGESLGEHGLWLKNNLYDCAARVPLVMAGPGLPRGAVVDTPVAHADLIRTFLECGGARTHSKLRGHSLLPLANGARGTHPGWAYSESHSEGNSTGSFMIRKGAWKYIHFTYHDGLLFNLDDDPGERENLFAGKSPGARAALEELRGILCAQVDPVEVTERAFRVQKKRMDRMVAGYDDTRMFAEFRGRLGDGQAIALLTAYCGRPLKIEPGKLKKAERLKS